MKITARKNIKPALIATAIVLLAVAGYMAYAWQNGLAPFVRENNPEPGDFTVNQEKSEAEKQAIQDLIDNPEDKIVNDQRDIPEAPTTNESTGKQNVYVLITHASIAGSTVIASGYAGNVAEGGGVCTYIFTQGDAVIKKTSSTMRSTTSTSCETVSFPTSELSAGTWRVALQYSSESSYGDSSNTKEITK